MQLRSSTQATVCVLVEPGVRERILGLLALVTSTTTSSPPPTLACWMSSSEACTRSTPIRTKRRTPFLVRRSPQFIASFSKSRFGSMPTRRGLAGSATLKTRIESSPLVTKSGAVCRKQPEMPTWLGSTPRCAMLPLCRDWSVASREAAIRSIRSRSP